eukprot:CAMPEP_0171092038 /NCGR_PEP_ID=MMETSP0766_2-20121228/35465_1 /TAXON_ID=439317 /ORGANISM="Gambierdiscus australes, Strain CAWD 149" /LENGTH=52 /DNA_ID=CAMNT_0011550231 /DNA_START=9 /DNA_END=163 /DNA_ORIENTATION=-
MAGWWLAGAWLAVQGAKALAHSTQGGGLERAGLLTLSTAGDAAPVPLPPVVR